MYRWAESFYSSTELGVGNSPGSLTQQVCRDPSGALTHNQKPLCRLIGRHSGSKTGVIGGFI